MSAGAGGREAPRNLDPDPFLVTLPGARRPVHVIAPPGSAGDLVPGWDSTTEFGSDDVAFSRAHYPPWE
jgi:hypothetical protein